MGVQQEANAKYQQLCIKLGDIEYKISRLQSDAAAVKAEITELDSSLPEKLAIEKAAQAPVEVSSEQKEQEAQTSN